MTTLTLNVKTLTCVNLFFYDFYFTLNTSECILIHNNFMIDEEKTTAARGTEGKKESKQKQAPVPLERTESVPDLSDVYYRSSFYVAEDPRNIRKRSHLNNSGFRASPGWKSASTYLRETEQREKPSRRGMDDETRLDREAAWELSRMQVPDESDGLRNKRRKLHHLSTELDERPVVGSPWSQEEWSSKYSNSVPYSVREEFVRGSKEFPWVLSDESAEDSSLSNMDSESRGDDEITKDTLSYTSYESSGNGSEYESDSDPHFLDEQGGFTSRKY